MAQTSLLFWSKVTFLEGGLDISLTTCTFGLGEYAKLEKKKKKNDKVKIERKGTLCSSKSCTYGHDT